MRIGSKLTRKGPQEQRRVMRARLGNQVRDILKGRRGLVVHWAFLTPASRSLKALAATPKSKAQFEKIRLAKAREGIKLTNGEITRMGFVPRQERNPTKRKEVLFLPQGEMGFFDYMQGLSSAERKKWMKEKANARDPKNHGTFVRAHDRLPYNVGFNSILEVGNDGHGNPTHILVLKRSASVPIEPNVWDFPAGLVQKGMHPFDAVRKRTAAELGIKEKELIHIGPGLKPTRDDYLFAMQRIDRLLNYNGIIIQRATIDVAKVRGIVEAHLAAERKKKNPWAPAGFQLIPRTPEALVKFYHQHPTFMPEVFRLYAQELRKVMKGK